LKTEKEIGRWKKYTMRSFVKYYSGEKIKAVHEARMFRNKMGTQNNNLKNLQEETTWENKVQMRGQ
jgi:hypothetical protein